MALPTEIPARDESKGPFPHVPGYRDWSYDTGVESGHRWLRVTWEGAGESAESAQLGHVEGCSCGCRLDPEDWAVVMVQDIIRLQERYRRMGIRSGGFVLPV